MRKRETKRKIDTEREIFEKRERFAEFFIRYDCVGTVEKCIALGSILLTALTFTFGINFFFRFRAFTHENPFTFSMFFFFW